MGETQVEEVQSYDEGVPIISITNGDDRSYSAKDFRRFFWGSFPDPDAAVEFPQSWQIETVKRTILVCNFLFWSPGREEKVGRKHAFTDENIEELVKAGAQVAIFGNVQQGEDSK